MIVGLVIFVDSLLLVLAGYLLWYIPWILFIVYPKKIKITFDNVLNFDKVAPLIKGRKFFYLSSYGLTIFSTLILDGAVITFSYQFGESAIALEEINLVGYLVTILLIFILFHIGFGFILWKLGKEMKPEKTKKEVVEDFIYFKEHWVDNQPIKKVVIQTAKKVRGIKADLSLQQKHESLKILRLDPAEEFALFLKVPRRKLYQQQASWMIGNPRALPLLEKIYRWKIKRLVKKGLKDEQYFWQLYRIFLAYLNKCANFVLITKMSNYEPFLSIDGHGISGVGELKEAFLNNFFSYEQEIQSLKNNS